MGPKNVTKLVIKSLNLRSDDSELTASDLAMIGRKFTKLEKCTFDYRHIPHYRTVKLNNEDLAFILDDNFQPQTEAEIIIQDKILEPMTHIFKMPSQKATI